MNQVLVQKAIDYAFELNKENNKRTIILINGINETTEVRPYLGQICRYERYMNALIVESSDGKKFIDINSINSIHCYKQKI